MDTTPPPDAAPTSDAPSWTASADVYAREADYVPRLGATILGWLDPRPGERILDLGCGDGALTIALVEAGAEVVGVDAAPDMIAAAQARGLDAHVADGRSLNGIEGPFGAVFSNAALHWIPDADEVIAAVARVLAPGGRFVAEFGGHGNVAAVTTALRAALLLEGVTGASAPAWFFPSPADYRRRLEHAGFEVAEIALVPRPTPLPTGMAMWLRTFAGSTLAGLDTATATAVLERCESLLAPSLHDGDGWMADYVRLRVRAGWPA